MILSERTRTITALGIVEILAWGSSFYLLAVLADPIRIDTGWPRELITAGISVGLLVSGLAAAQVGNLIQIHGGRRILATGMTLIAAGLTVLALSQGIGMFLGGWLLIGLGMGAGLYDAAFSTLGRIYGSAARGPITALTLWGGFASTVCWPLTAFMADHLGWRGTCLAYAAMHLAITVPLCIYGLPRGKPQPAQAEDDETGPAPNALADHRFWCVALGGTVLVMMSSVWSVHLITVLTSTGHTVAAAVGLGALIGPAQVGARLVEMLGGGKHHPVWTFVISTSLVAVGFLGLRMGLPAAAALIAYGGGNGLWSIARGSLPLSLFGPRDYARIMGRLATPILIASAAAPLIGGVLIARIGPQGLLDVLSAAAALPLLAALILLRTVIRDTRRATAAGE